MHFSRIHRRSLGFSSICDGSRALPAVLLLVVTTVLRVVVTEREAYVASCPLLVATTFFKRLLWRGTVIYSISGAHCEQRYRDEDGAYFARVLGAAGVQGG